MSEASEALGVEQGERTPNPTELYMGAVMHDGFIKALRSAGGIVRRSGYEAGFCLGLTGSNEYWFSPIKRGYASEMNRPPESASEIRRETKEDIARQNLNVKDLLYAHFHPSSNLIPSYDDLASLSMGNISDGEGSPRFFMGIGVVDGKGEINLLLLRIVSKGIPGRVLLEDVKDSLKEIEFNPCPDSLPTESTKLKLLAVFNETGFYKATIISLPKDQQEWSELERSRLRDFFG